MRKLGFWKDDNAQVRAINEAAGELDALNSSTHALGSQLLALRRVVDGQQVQIVQLRSALQAICDLLVDLDLIEAQALEYRVDAAMTDASEPAIPSPFDLPPSPRQPRAEAVCVRCHRDVPAPEISFTDRGPMCDACAAAIATESSE